jgi:hypothetical protein
MVSETRVGENELLTTRLTPSKDKVTHKLAPRLVALGTERL